MSLCALPEELLERIVWHALPPPSSPSYSRPPWLRSPTHHDTRLALLRVAPILTRIATPLLYHDVILSSPTKASLLLRTLQTRPELAASIRCLVVAGLWTDAAAVLALCAAETLQVLDITISFDGGEQGDETWGHALAGLVGVRHLTLHKPQAVYLSLVRPRRFIHALARAIPRWPHLQTTHIAFKLSDDTPSSPVTSPALAGLFSPFSLAPSLPGPPAAIIVSPPAPHRPTSATTTTGPISALTQALARAPALHTFTTHLPSVWNAAVLTISTNPSLERIGLLDGRCNTPHTPGLLLPSPAGAVLSPTCGTGIVGTGLFLMEARRHVRLAELIRAGTPLMRGRAHTMGTVASGAASAATATSSSDAAGTPPPPPPLTTTTTGAVPGVGLALRKRPSGVGLGLGVAVAVSADVCAPAPTTGNGITGSGAVNPSWIGSPRPAAKGKGKGRR
ncbi:hypothetical protein DXG03_006326 [Asterophora parasitica]|uniref:Uncharacterized protein n=1 Tax=Asterophora parasitica TaxID=117018 RepID=A0A9P7KCA1_9AGAR|nr:hypothetical protein DXG03_006326 [Asterophora parasitica]